MASVVCVECGAEGGGWWSATKKYSRRAVGRGRW
jgi:hypothetical protein